MQIREVMTTNLSIFDVIRGESDRIALRYLSEGNLLGSRRMPDNGQVTMAAWNS